MKLAGFVGTALGLGLPLALGACGGSSSGSGTFEIVSCNLGCSSAGGQFSCGIQNVFVNGEVRIRFNQPVAGDSASAFSFQVTEVAAGKTPDGEYLVDPASPETLIFRPLVSFDSSGAPTFGLLSGSVYEIKLPGLTQDPEGPFVTSIDGTPNQNRLLCTVSASLGVLDVQPGAPVATVTVDKVVLDPVTGEVIGKETGVPAGGAVDVASDTSIRFRFDDLMNPALLVNPVAGTSPSITVRVDPDGDVVDASDQQEIPGAFSIALDQDAIATTVVFTPSQDLPSSGSDALKPRKIVVSLGAAIVDLGGNPLENAGLVVFTPQQIAFQEVTLAESFATQLAEDTDATGAAWGGGMLALGSGGSSGRLGPLTLAAGDELVLRTDLEDFSGVSDATVFDPASAIGASFDGQDFTAPPAVGGVFEFSSLHVADGATLRFEGPEPARVHVRGEATLFGTLDVAGGSAAIHADLSVAGGAGGAPGPAGGAGGRGGALPDGEAFLAIGGVDNPNDPTLAELDGAPGQGIAFPSQLDPQELRGQGAGGPHWPQANPANPGFHLPVDPTDISGLVFSTVLCETRLKGGVGSGGAHGLSGTAGVNNPLFGAIPSLEPPTVAPGTTVDLAITAAVKQLDPATGFLRGGAGGGGGGAHVAESRSGGSPFPSQCQLTAGGAPAVLIDYVQHSGPGGGGGGGGAQVQAGRRLRVDGVCDASGGAGGGRDPSSFETRVTAGGGGAGGALLLQAPTVQIASIPGRLDVSGGPGGEGVGGSSGGDGGAGILRIETLADPPPALATEAPKILPTEAALQAVGATLSDVVSIGAWQPVTAGPGALSGAQSCWLAPAGNFFLLDLAADDAEELGWDLKVLFDTPGLAPQSYRGENELTALSLEEEWGTALGSAPLVVRFQGARRIDPAVDLCDLVLRGPDASIEPGSLTGWVAHPAELDTFFAVPSLRPNVVRFQIVFDTSQAAFAGITGVTDVEIRVLPD